MTAATVQSLIENPIEKFIKTVFDKLQI